MREFVGAGLALPDKDKGFKPLVLGKASGRGKPRPYSIMGN